jgi:alginate O-acetyltransferase complex protein AlgI
VIFHSLDFVVFFLVVTAIYWTLPRRGQNALLLVASYFFYGYVHPWFLTLIAATTVADYLAARGMDAWPDRRRLMLGLSLAVNLGLLGFFKYFNFFAENVHGALALVGLDVSMPALRVILPVGISFYTFQELSYTIEVYRGTMKARRDFLDFATFVCFFPQLVAGPIERASHLLPQVEQPRRWSWDASRDAAGLILWGYFKKLVIADNVGVVANKVFALQTPGFWVLWAGVFAFAIQIYADFSAYSDIARGTAKWLGFDLMRNFNQPYAATGPGDFWRRWHISLSSWFRDYVFIPLGGSRGTQARTMANLMATFLVSGLWHGASWNYVIWGAYHGTLVVLGRIAGTPRGPRSQRGPRGAASVFRAAPMFVLTLVGWLIFRETDIQMLLHDFTLVPWRTTAEDMRIGAYLFLTVAIFTLPLAIDTAWAMWRERRADDSVGATDSVTSARAWLWRAALAGAGFALILVFRSRQSLDFIYFQF